jgi:hypothetical protein
VFSCAFFDKLSKTEAMVYSPLLPEPIKITDIPKKLASNVKISEKVFSTRILPRKAADIGEASSSGVFHG